MPRIPHPWCCRECSLGQKLIEGMCWCECHAEAFKRTGKPIWRPK